MKARLLGFGSVEVDGTVPILREVRDEAARRGIELVALPTREACALIETLDAREVRAVLHVTC